ncbi:Fic family protein [Lewinella aquimaris]|uniref:Fic family protein n=1 Tax=Neolewinella aquimaris TaxID=1835722 RepID=A0A840E6L1_9BACT|nr:Fic family protein [Neolewinella aquimaris]MBB4080811.1 Fic family protein [Neolewinella aquimaris]
MDQKLQLDFKATQTVIREIAYIDSFKGKWKGLELKESALLRELRQIATIASIGSSTRIEGSALTNEEVESLLSNLSMSELKARDEQEVYGYYEVLELVLESHPDIELTKNNIHHLHKLLLKASAKDEYHRGDYKRTTNKVVAKYPGGSEKVIFNTTEPGKVSDEMEAIIAWTKLHLAGNEYHPLIVIATFVYEFLSIHPYQDGNGRLSRLLTTLLLLRQDYDFMNYASMETEIEKRKKEYYRVLMSCQQNRYTNKENIGDWIVYFLRMLHEAIEILESRFDKIRVAKSYLNDRQKHILSFIRANEPVKISDVSEEFTGETIHTLRKDMGYLKAENKIKQVGKGRATIYYVKE